jgi:hypothetical protein
MTNLIAGFIFDKVAKQVLVFFHKKTSQISFLIIQNMSNKLCLLHELYILFSGSDSTSLIKLFLV